MLRKVSAAFGQRNLRVLLAFTLMSWALPLSLWGCEKFFNPRDDFADQGITGPYAVEATGQSYNGRSVYRVTGALDVVPAGSRFGWVSTVCIEAGRTMDAVADVVRMSDGVVVTAGPHRLWTPSDKRCGPAVGSLIMSDDAAPGVYELRRSATLRPGSWFPLKVELTGLRFQVVPGTKRTP